MIYSARISLFYFTKNSPFLPLFLGRVQALKKRPYTFSLFCDKRAYFYKRDNHAHQELLFKRFSQFLCMLRTLSNAIYPHS